MVVRSTFKLYVAASHFSRKRGEEQNREEGEMAQKKLGGGRNRGKSREEGEKEKLGVGRIELDGPG